MSLHRRTTFKDGNEDRDVQSLFDWINQQTEPVTFTVPAPGAAVVVAHRLEYVPRMAIQVVTPLTTGTGTVYPGGVAWTTTTVSLTASAAGDYAVIIRR